MRLSKRLESILNLLPDAECIADIGCDHGRLSAELLSRGKAKKVICSDISAPSLAKAQKLAEERGLSEKMECRLGSGLKVLKIGETDAAVIAGMGGPLIVEILKDNEDIAANISVLVLEPNIYPDRVRRYLTENGWIIEKEDLILEEGKFYPVLRAVRGKGKPYSETELLAGRWNSRPPRDFFSYVAFWRDRYRKIVSGIRAEGSRDEGAERLLELWEKLAGQWNG